MPMSSDLIIRRRRRLPDGVYQELDFTDHEDDDNSDATPTMLNDTPAIISINDNMDNDGVEGVARAVPPVPRPQESRAERESRLRQIRRRQRARLRRSNQRYRLRVVRVEEDIEFYIRETYLGPPITREDRSRFPATDFPYNLRPTRVLRPADPTEQHLRVRDEGSWRRSLRNQDEDEEAEHPNNQSRAITITDLVTSIVVDSDDSDDMVDYNP
jgi:hypothetical protein